jgi:mannosyltransferase
MLFFRFFGAKFTLIATRHAETPPSKFTLNLLKKADKTVTLTKSMSKSLAIKNIIIGHGVNVDLFIPKSQSTLSSISQKNIILCAGRVRASKGQETLLEAAKVLKENKNWALVLVGKVEKPSFLQKLQTIAEKYFIENQVYFVNETLDISSYYQAAKVVVVPSFSEGFSLVAAEAMSCECSVIATQKVGVHSLLIKHGKNGYLFEAGNVAQLEKLILGLIKDENLFLGKEARKEITKNWSSKTEANKLIELYQE